MNPMQFTLFSPTKLLFGAGKLAALGEETLPGRKALLLLSSGKSARLSGALDIVAAQMEKAGVTSVPCAIFSATVTRRAWSCAVIRWKPSDGFGHFPCWRCRNAWQSPRQE